MDEPLLKLRPIEPVASQHCSGCFGGCSVQTLEIAESGPISTLVNRTALLIYGTPLLALLGVVIALPSRFSLWQAAVCIFGALILVACGLMLRLRRIEGLAVKLLP